MSEEKFDAMFKDVPAILEKGQDLKKSEIKLLLEEGVHQRYIAEALDMSDSEFLVLMENWGFSHHPITLNKYMSVYTNFPSDKHLAAHYNMEFYTFAWLKKIWMKSGAVIPQRERKTAGLTLEVYNKLKAKGYKDKEIAAQFGISPRTVNEKKKRWRLI